MSDVTPHRPLIDSSTLFPTASDITQLQETLKCSLQGNYCTWPNPLTDHLLVIVEDMDELRDKSKNVQLHIPSKYQRQMSKKSEVFVPKDNVIHDRYHCY